MIRKTLITIMAAASIGTGLQLVNPAPAQALNGTVINHCSSTVRQALQYGYSNSRTYRYFLPCGQGESGVGWFTSPKKFFVNSTSGLRHTYPAGTYIYTTPGVTYYVTSQA